MDTHDHSDPNALGSIPGGSYPHADWAAGLGSGPAPRSGRRSILRGLAGHWWRILSLWVLVSAPVTYLIYTLVDPTYEAISLLQAEPTTAELFSPALRGTPDTSADRRYLLTQINLLKSQSVLDAALARPEISGLPMIRSSKDPKADLGERLRIEIIGDNTYLLRVSLDSRDPDETAAIVNAVVEAYISQHNRYHQLTNLTLKTSLVAERNRLEQQIQEKQDELQKLVEKGNVSVNRLAPAELVDKAADKGAVKPSLRTVTEQQFEVMSSRLLQADFDLMDARARREAARLPGAQAPAEKIRELDSAVEAASLKRSSYQQYIEKIRVIGQAQSSEQLRASLWNQDLTYLRKLQDTIKQKLAQLEFEIGQEHYKIVVRDKAEVPKAPSTNRRLTYIPLASAGILFLILGAFLVREITATRTDRPL
jgi:uncharacterized protein involved in exopolysaccharide biosynthesis